MDLIITDKTHTDIGMVDKFNLDLEMGDGDNDFVVLLPEEYRLEEGSLIYVDGTDIGGVIDNVEADEFVRYGGRTFPGILKAKVVCPPKGKTHYISNGDANDCLRDVISKCGLKDLFTVPNVKSGFTLKNFKWDRYSDAWTGIRKMLRKVKAKPKFIHENGKVSLCAVSAENYGNDIDSDLATFNLKFNFKPVNHLVCAGKGEMENRVETHFYADNKGRVSHKQFYFGLDEVTEFYDYTNADAQKLEEEGEKKLKDYQVNGDIDIDVLDESISFDVGDIVTGYNHAINKEVKAEVIRKIVKADNGVVQINYDIGQPAFTKGFVVWGS